MGSVETFDHTADLGLRITAADLPDLFRTAAGGLFDVIVANRGDVVPREAEDVDLAAEGPADLLVAWLGELIYRSETGHRLYSGFEIEVRDEGRRLTGRIFGEPMDAGRHVLDHEVKAVTHHGLTLAREGAGWAAEVILDI